MQDLDRVSLYSLFWFSWIIFSLCKEHLIHFVGKGFSILIYWEIQESFHIVRQRHFATKIINHWQFQFQCVFLLNDEVVFKAISLPWRKTLNLGKLHKCELIWIELHCIELFTTIGFNQINQEFDRTQFSKIKWIEHNQAWESNKQNLTHNYSLICKVT